MKAAAPRARRPRALALCLLSALLSPALAQAAPPSNKPQKKAPVRKGSFKTYLVAASRLYENLEYERALEQLARAKELAKGQEEDVLVALYEGIILADLGRREQSLAALRTALYLQPDAVLPVKVSPKVERDFEALRQDVQRELARVSGTDSASPAPASDAPVKPAEPPALASRVESAQPPADTGAPALQPAALEPQAPGRSTPVLPWVLLGTGAVAGGMGGFFGLRAQGNVQAARAGGFQDVRMARLEEARSQALLANVLFGTAAAAALGALGTAIFSAGAESSAAPATSEGATP